MKDSGIALFRAPELDGLLDPALCRALPRVPPGGLESLPRPAALLLDARCYGWLDAAASDPELACLWLVRLDEAVPDDPRIDDLVMPAAAEAELLMRARRALRRKRARAVAAGVSADLDGVRWGERVVALSAAEARVATRLLAEAGSVVSELALADAAFGDAPWTRRALHAHIYRLRTKLRSIPVVEIQTVRQRGFRAVVKPMRDAERSATACEPPGEA